MIQSNSINIFKEYLNNAKPLPLIGVSLVIVSLLGIGSVTLLSNTAVYMFGVLAALPFIWFILHSPKLWIYILVLSGALYFSDRGGELSASDVITAIYYMGGITIWFVYAVGIKRKKLIRNKADFIILFFYTVLFLNCIIALLNGVEFLFWFREYLVFIMILYYFPIRDIFTNKKDLIVLLILLLVSITVLDFFQFYGYFKAATEDLKYAYQLGRSIRTNQTWYTVGAAFGILFFFNVKGKVFKLIMILYSGLTVAALVTSFSRTFWVLLIVQTAVIFLYLPFRKKLQLSSLVGFIVVIVTSLAFLFMQDNTKLLFGVIEKRFLSTTEGTRDVSVQARISEYKSALKEAYKYPLSGNGFAKEFSFYNPITNETTRYTIIHNSYISFFYRIGIPLSLMFFSVMIFYLIYGFKLSLLIKDQFYRYVAIGAYLSMFMMIVGSFSTPLFLFKDGTFITAYSIAFIGLAAEEYKRQKERLLLGTPE